MINTLLNAMLFVVFTIGVGMAGLAIFAALGSRNGRP